MITKVHLTNWRAYGDVEIQLEAGTTFLIGMNGVGKTSFLEAVRWAFDPSPKADIEYIRKGQRVASVEVTVQVGAETTRVKRTLSLGDKPQPRATPTEERDAWIDDRKVSVDEFFRHLEAAWGADIGFVTRIAFLDADLSGPTITNELRAHLCRAYNLDTIEENVRVLDGEIKKAAKDADTEYRAGADLRGKILEVEQELHDREAELLSSDSQAADLALALQAATDTLAQAQDLQDAVEQQRRWDADWDGLAEACGELIASPAPGTDLRPLLQSSCAAAARQLDEARDANARLRERISALEGALQVLAAAEGDCPVCRRPLDDESRSHAHDVQQADLDRAARELQIVDLASTSAVLSDIQRLLDQAERLGERPDVPESAASDVGAAQAALDEVQRQRDVLLGARGATNQRIIHSRAELAELNQQEAAAANAPAAYRRLAILTASRDALRETVTKVLDAQIAPIGQEISSRWDGVFPDRPGLMVDSDGTLSRSVPGGQLRYSSFSAGEQTVARLLLKLATVIRTTKVPFCWIDEPLAHLDEKSQLVVARTLAQFGKVRVLDQIFVTTYEQSLASMVEHSSDGPRVEYLGTAQVSS